MSETVLDVYDAELLRDRYESLRKLVELGEPRLIATMRHRGGSGRLCEHVQGDGTALVVLYARNVESDSGGRFALALGVGELYQGYLWQPYLLVTIPPRQNYFLEVPVSLEGLAVPPGSVRLFGWEIAE